jgi:hypothetical protein
MVAVALSLIAPGTLAADAESLLLTVTLDRVVYVEDEPIIAEWTLTNAAGHELRLCPAIECGALLKYIISDSAGLAKGGTSRIGSPKAAAATVFPAGKVLKGWVNLNEECALSLPSGGYQVRAHLDTSAFGGSDGIWLGRVSSEAAALKVENVGGDDLKAVELLRIAAAKNGGGRTYRILRNYDAARAVATLTKSPRFVPAANFFLGQHQLQWLEMPGGGMITDQRMGEAQEGFEQCIKLSDNQYLKGLARYYLLRAKSLEPQHFSVEEAEKRIAEIMKEHPGTYAAWKAPEVLEKLKAAQKKKE